MKMLFEEPIINVMNVNFEAVSNGDITVLPGYGNGSDEGSDW